MSGDERITDPAAIRATWEEPEDRDGRYWAAISRDQARQTVDAVTRLADSEQAAVQRRLDEAEKRIDDLLDTIARVRSLLVHLHTDLVYAGDVRAALGES